jgi:hypothetical protein
MNAVLPAHWILLATAIRSGPAATDSLPPIGLAWRDVEGTWCATVAAGPLVPGTPVTLVFPAPDAPVVARAARVVRRRPEPCPSEFAQGSLEGLPAYDLAAAGPDVEGVPSVALAVAGPAVWRRGPDGAARADMDGDGRPERASVCAADEGEHFTVWTDDSAGAPRLRWHGYYDWGGLVDPTCQPGEDGRERAGAGS